MQYLHVKVLEHAHLLNFLSDKQGDYGVDQKIKYHI